MNTLVKPLNLRYNRVRKSQNKELTYMQVLFFVLNAPEKLDELLSQMERHGIHGATIFESTGMARVLKSHHDEDEFEFLSAVPNVSIPQSSEKLYPYDPAGRRSNRRGRRNH